MITLLQLTDNMPISDQMKNSLVNARIIKIKLIQSGVYNIINIEKVFRDILPTNLYGDIRQFGTDIMILLKCAQSDLMDVKRYTFDLYNTIDNFIFRFFETNKNRLCEILNKQELDFLLSNRFTKLFYSIEHPNSTDIIIRI